MIASLRAELERTKTQRDLAHTAFETAMRERKKLRGLLKQASKIFTRCLSLHARLNPTKNEIIALIKEIDAELW